MAILSSRPSALTCVPYGDITMASRQDIPTRQRVVVVFEKSFEAIREEFSGQATGGYVIDITRYHWMQASPGFRKAAH